MRCGGCAMPFQKLIQALRSWKRSIQKLGLERDQSSIEIMQRVTGLHFMILKKPIPCALAVVRYTAWMGLSDMEPRIFDVTETLYEDTLIGLEQLQDDILDAMHSGVDCCVITHDEVENFPRLQNLLNV